MRLQGVLKTRLRTVQYNRAAEIVLYGRLVDGWLNYMVLLFIHRNVQHRFAHAHYARVYTITCLPTAYNGASDQLHRVAC